MVNARDLTRGKRRTSVIFSHTQTYGVTPWVLGINKTAREPAADVYLRSIVEKMPDFSTTNVTPGGPKKKFSGFIFRPWAHEMKPSAGSTRPARHMHVGGSHSAFLEGLNRRHPAQGFTRILRGVQALRRKGRRPKRFPFTQV
jgi:hypothetical protein